MDPLTAARAQMEVSLGFHMVFAALGIAMPLFMVIAEALWLRTKKPHYKELARKWGKATALLFAVGAVSGTALSFELGLLWPRFMELAGGVVGPAFTLEGYAFFVEAVFVGLYLYGWERLSPRAHWLCGLPVAISGVASGVLVVAANAWMQHPGDGLVVEDGRIVNASATATFESPMWLPMSIHSTLSCFIAVGFACAGVYALSALRKKTTDAYHRSALNISLGVAAVAAVLQIASGDMSAKAVARYEPAKLAAAESHFETASGVPLFIGGIPDPDAQTVSFAIEIPKGLSFMAHGDFDATVRGLNEFPRDEWPNVVVSHLAFQVMVGCGAALAGLGVLYWLLRWRKRESAWILRGLVLASPLGFIALEAGWVVTEVGRQPWIVHGIMRTKDAITPAPHVQLTFVVFTALYVGLGIALVALLRHIAKPKVAEVKVGEVKA